MFAGQALTALDFRGVGPPPFVAPESRDVGVWTMSQRTGSLSYLTFATGFSLAVYAFFLWYCDVRGVSFAVFRTLGRNALAAYLLHGMVSSLVASYAPRDAPAWYVTGALGVYLGINWLFVRALERRQLFLRL
jgi:hypothetical protein